ncbi:MAG: 30S ribosomal protein S5 [Thermoplasmatales archaeon]
MTKEAIEWVPKTRLGKMVKEGQLKSIAEVIAMHVPIREPGIVDALLPNLEDEVIEIKMVQKMSDSGRKVKFAATVVVGNRDGYVGMRHAKARETGDAIEKAIENAKLNIIEIKRGCGSWECGCGRSHTLPFEVMGKSGSVRVYLKPAPQGVGLAIGDIPKKVLAMAGIQDTWGFSEGHTKSTVNFAYATFNALKETVRFKINSKLVLSTPIYKGGVMSVSSNQNQGKQ